MTTTTRFTLARAATPGAFAISARRTVSARPAR